MQKIFLKVALSVVYFLFLLHDGHGIPVPEAEETHRVLTVKSIAFHPHISQPDFNLSALEGLPYLSRITLQATGYTGSECWGELVIEDPTLHDGKKFARRNNDPKFDIPGAWLEEHPAGTTYTNCEPGSAPFTVYDDDGCLTFLACTQTSPEASLLGKTERTVKNFVQNLATYYLNAHDPKSFESIHKLLQKEFRSLRNEYYSALEQNQSDGTLFATSVVLKTVQHVNPLSINDLVQDIETNESTSYGLLRRIFSVVPQNMPSLLYRTMAVPHAIPGGAPFHIAWPAFNPEEAPTDPSKHKNPIFIAAENQSHWTLQIEEITGTHWATAHTCQCSVIYASGRVGTSSSFDFQIIFQNGSSLKVGPLYTYNPPAETGDIGPQSTTTLSEVMTFCREQLNTYIRGHSAQLLRILR